MTETSKPLSKPVPVLLTVNETASLLRCHPMTVYRHVADGHLPALRVGGLIRIPAEFLEPARAPLRVDELARFPREGTDG